MASVTSLMNSSYNTSSIYGSRNVLSGLASGMDTETMIENAVSGIKTKIQNLLKKRTRVEWQQEAYRSIIDKAVNLNTRYTSYSSKTNLLSSAFFTNSVITTTKGTYADKVTASGKTSSDIKINAVKQLATAASYTVSGLGGKSGEYTSINTEKEFDITGATTVSTVSGSLTFQYGGSNGTTFTINFDELENIDEVEVYNKDGSVNKNASGAEKLAQAINNKLREVSYSYTQNGVRETITADKVIHVEADPIFGDIGISDGLGKGNTVTVSSASGDIADTLGITKGDRSINGNRALTKEVDTREYLAGKELDVTLNGTTKKISMDKVIAQTDFNQRYNNDINESFKNALQSELDKTFGEGKITVDQAPFNGKGEGGQLSFSASAGSTVTLGGSAVGGLGFTSGDSNYINTGKKLSELMGNDFFKNASRAKGEFDAGAKPQLSKNGTYYLDSKGNRVDEKGYRVSSDGKALYDFSINDTQIEVTEDTTLEELINSINSNVDAGVKISYSQLTNEFKFTATETGANGRIDFGGMAKDLFGSPEAIRSMSAQDSFAERFGIDLGDKEDQFVAITSDVGTVGFWITKDTTIEEAVASANKLFGNGFQATVTYDDASNQIILKDKNGNQVDYKLCLGENSRTEKEDYVEVEYTPVTSRYTAGTDAVMDVEINGKRFENLSRSSNSFDIDGMTINVKDTFNVDGSNVDKDGGVIEPITFESTTDSDKIVDAIRSFVNDYNEMITELKSAYTTQPQTDSKKNRYDPLTAEQEAEYTESELAAYYEKAKQGILFGDTTLSSMYGKLLNAIAPGGADGQVLREIGIGTSYENGLTTISLDEDKLRAALDSDPDKVKNAFTKTTEGGSSSDGLMQTLQNTLNTYVRTTGEPKGVLITRAGSIKAPTSLNNNSLQSQIDSFDKQIERWQNKMSDQIDRYTTQFSRLEQLIAAMNSQASAMYGLMGGGEGY